MDKLEIFCRNCDRKLADNTIVAFYQQSLNPSIHLIIKPECMNNTLHCFIIKEQTEKKKKKFAPEVIFCKACDIKIGTKANIGPEDRPVLCFRAESIYFIEILSNFRKRSDFNFESKWVKLKNNFQILEFRNYSNFDSSSNAIGVVRENFTVTILPKENDLVDFNIGLYVADIPRWYQTELFVKAALGNSIVYLPTGSGKTMVAAMVISFFKRLNSKKKFFFVVDRVPLVFQQASYLRYQCDLTVGEFCGENKALFESQLDCDIYVLTAGFLVNMLLLKKLYLEDCSCLVIDEIHHAKKGSNFFNLIDQFYDNVDSKYKPRILGCNFNLFFFKKNFKRFQ